MESMYIKSAKTVPLSAEQAEFAFMLFACLRDSNVDLTSAFVSSYIHKTYGPAVFSVAREWLLLNEDCQTEAEQRTLKFLVDSSHTGILISHLESFDIKQASDFIHLLLKHFDSDQTVSLECSFDCDRPLSDAFGGSAAFISKTLVKHFSTAHWLEQQRMLCKSNHQLTGA